MDGWMKGCMDEWMDGCLAGWLYGRMAGWLDGWVNGWKQGSCLRSRSHMRPTGPSAGHPTASLQLLHERWTRRGPYPPAEMLRVRPISLPRTSFPTKIFQGLAGSPYLRESGLIGCLATWLPSGCQAAWPPGCLAAMQHGQLAVCWGS